MKKPSACIGCPLYNKGTSGFVADYIPHGTQVIVVQDVPPKNINGSSADDTYDAKLFKREFEVELKGAVVGWSHLLRCTHGKSGDELIKGKNFKAAVEHCRRHDQFGNSVLVAIGPGSWKYLSKLKVTKKNSRKFWQGYYVEVE